MEVAGMQRKPAFVLLERAGHDAETQQVHAVTLAVTIPYTVRSRQTLPGSVEKPRPDPAYAGPASASGESVVTRQRPPTGQPATTTFAAFCRFVTGYPPGLAKASPNSAPSGHHGDSEGPRDVLTSVGQQRERQGSGMSRRTTRTEPTLGSALCGPAGLSGSEPSSRWRPW